MMQRIEELQRVNSNSNNTGLRLFVEMKRCTRRPPKIEDGEENWENTHTRLTSEARALFSSERLKM